MSQPVPPNQPQPAVRRPARRRQSVRRPAAGQPGQPGVPTGNPFAGQQPGQPGQFGGVPFAPAPAPTRNNVGLGVPPRSPPPSSPAILYGGITGAIEREIGYAAIGVGFLVGFAAGKVGGRNPVLPIVSAVLSLVAVYLGQLIGMAVIVSDKFSVSFTDVFFDQFSVLTDAWKRDRGLHDVPLLRHRRVRRVRGAKKAEQTDRTHTGGPGPLMRSGPSRMSERNQRRCCESATVTSTRWNSLRSL